MAYGEKVRDTPNFLIWFLVFGMLTLCAVFAGMKFAPGDWYNAIDKPDWTPPGYVFPLVWTPLYVFMAIAGALVWTAYQNKAIPIFLWFAQLALNGVWSWLFFGEYRIDAALLDIGLLVLVVAAFIWFSWRASKAAAVLFVPYLAWICIAFALNAHIWMLNGWPTGSFIPPGF